MYIFQFQKVFTWEFNVIIFYFFKKIRRNYNLQIILNNVLNILEINT